jgi:hypothetical protein
VREGDGGRVVVAGGSAGVLGGAVRLGGSAFLGAALFAGGCFGDRVRVGGCGAVWRSLGVESVGWVGMGVGAGVVGVGV